MEKFNIQAFMQRLGTPLEGQNNLDGTRNIAQEIRTHLANLDMAAASAEHPDELRRAGLQKLVGVHGRDTVAQALRFPDFVN